jgi:hypothetical protein
VEYSRWHPLTHSATASVANGVAILDVRRVAIIPRKTLELLGSNWIQTLWQDSRSERGIPTPQNPLTHRRFTDTHGKTWDVWQVHPAAAERRFSQRRVNDEDRTDSAERRSGTDRREERLSRALIAPEFTYGWLCFETQGEKRRLAPVPERWDSADDETIEQWCCVAKPVVRRPSGAIRREGGDQKLS